MTERPGHSEGAFWSFMERMGFVGKCVQLYGGR